MEATNVEKHRILPAEEIHRKYYSEVPDDVFTKIVSADVVSSNLQRQKLGKYAKWMLHLYRKNWLKIEDLYKVKEYIPVFDKALKSNKLSERDVNRYKSPADMYVAIEPFIEKPAVSNKQKIQQTKQYDAEKLYEDEIFTVIHPMTVAASCYYGMGTQWCTAASKSHNLFKSYNNQGKLYIIIDKIDKRKYQFHFETFNFRDEPDRTIPGTVLETIKATFGLTRFFYQQITNIVRYAVEDGFLFITSFHGLYGIRKVNADKSSKVVLPAEFTGIDRYISKDNLLFNMLFVVQKDGDTGLYDYYANTIQWKLTVRRRREVRQSIIWNSKTRILLRQLFPSYLEYPLNIAPNKQNLRIRCPLTDTEKITFGYSPVCLMKYRHRLPQDI
jgi:hypothetical protein